MLVENLLDAYRQGAFPMADADTGEIRFYYALRRGIFPIAPGDPAGRFHVPRSLRRRLNSGWFDVRIDTAFDEVVRACAEPRPDDDQTWISDEIARWFGLLHAAGHAHSVEAWRADPRTGEPRLVGGVYGLAIGGAFFGESMFSRPRRRRPDGSRDPLDGTDASKVCLVSLVERLRRRGFSLFDTQLVNPHLARLGCVEIPHEEYMRRLADAVAAPALWDGIGRGDG
ncbi:MAG: leucyl/phenylalanyl-tRNA--protein transferase [Planctomycetota bacterium]|nr:MAG: leucyl/phenylalanyl-tRNA--protein transferase [Planctomycetota bacterium]